jgi:hypothetical protein
MPDWPGNGRRRRLPIWEVVKRITCLIDRQIIIELGLSRKLGGNYGRISRELA